LRLIRLVLEEGLDLTKVSKLLHIKRPTAKVILKRFKENGTFFRKKSADAKTKDSIPSNN
jgi:transposase